MSMSKRFGAEFLGTFWLTFGGCGARVRVDQTKPMGIKRRATRDRREVTQSTHSPAAL